MGEKEAQLAEFEPTEIPTNIFPGEAIYQILTTSMPTAS